MKAFTWLAMLALVQAACAAPEDNEELKRARAEVRKTAKRGISLSGQQVATYDVLTYLVCYTQLCMP